MCHPSISDESTLTSTSWKRVPCPKRSSTPKLFQLWSKGWWFDCDIKSQGLLRISTFREFFCSRPTKPHLPSSHLITWNQQVKVLQKWLPWGRGVKPAISTGRPRITKLYQIQVTPSDLVGSCYVCLDPFSTTIVWCSFWLLFGDDSLDALETFGRVAKDSQGMVRPTLKNGCYTNVKST